MSLMEHDNGTGSRFAALGQLDHDVLAQEPLAQERRPSRPSLDSVEQPRRPHAKSAGQPHHRGETGLAHCPLQAADLGGVQVARVPKLLLREANPHALAAPGAGELLMWRHPAMLRRGRPTGLEPKTQACDKLL